MREVWERAARAKAVRGAALAAIAAATVAGSAPAVGAQDPPGNNGTIKVDELDMDTTPENSPHQECEFRIEFRGYDEGDLTGTVAFTAVPPVADGGRQRGALLLEDELDIGEDEAGGANDLDATRVYDLSDSLVGVFEPHDVQGWHVRLDIEAEGSIGADDKHKVFWVRGCGDDTTTTTTTEPDSTTTTTESDSTTTTTESDSTTSTTASVPDDSTPPSDNPGDDNPGTPGDTTDVAPVDSPAPSGELPNTGSNSVPLAVLALGLVGLGTGGVLAARRLRSTDGVA